MMFLQGNNSINLNQVTLNKIISDWFNEATVGGTKAVLTFERLENNSHVFSIKDQASEDQGNS